MRQVIVGRLSGVDFWGHGKEERGAGDSLGRSPAAVLSPGLVRRANRPKQGRRFAFAAALLKFFRERVAGVRSVA